MSLQHGLLGMLRISPMTGYDIMTTFNESLTFFWSAQTSQIYRDLDTLEKKGYLSSKKEVQQGKPDKRIYSITPEGIEHLDQWLSSNDFSKNQKNRNPVLMQIFVSQPRNTEHLIASLSSLKNEKQDFLNQSEKISATIEQYARNATQTNKNAATFWKIVHLHGEIFAKAHIQWTEKAIEMLKEIQ